MPLQHVTTARSPVGCMVLRIEKMFDHWYVTVGTTYTSETPIKHAEDVNSQAVKWKEAFSHCGFFSNAVLRITEFGNERVEVF